MQRKEDCKDCALRNTETKTPCLPGQLITAQRDVEDWTERPVVMVVGLNPNPLEDMWATAGKGDVRNLLGQFLGQVDFYYTNLTKCRTKSKINIQHLRKCEQFFKQEYDEVKPAIVVALGEHVRKFILGNTDDKRVTRGAGYHSVRYGWVIPTWDGLTIYKQPWKSDEVFTDLYIAAKFATTKRHLKKVEFVRNSVEALRIARRSDSIFAITFDIETDGDSVDDTLDQAKAWPWILTVTVSGVQGDVHFLYDRNAYLEGMWDLVAREIKGATKNFPNVLVVAQNGKFDLKFLRYHCTEWIDIEVTFDTQLAHHIINENTSHSLNHLEWRYLPHLAGHKGEVNLGVKTCHEHDQDILEQYAAKDTLATNLIVTPLLLALKPEQLPLVRMVSRASSVLASTEAFGCRIDTTLLQQQLANVGGTAFTLEDALREQALSLGVDEFNPNSPTQVQALLYRTLKLPQQLGDDGFVSSDDVALEGLLEACDSEEQSSTVEALRMYREYEKQRSTLVGIKDRLRHDKNGSYVATQYNMSSVVTGRMSSSNPNLQNIPREGGVKNIFIPRDGHCFVEVDLKQAEYKVAAQMAQDPKMLAVLAAGEDFHQATVEVLASLGCFVIRDKAKRINFAILYGAGDKRVATLSKLPLQEVQYIQQMLKKAFPDFDTYFRNLPELARRNGNKIVGLFGRARHVPYLSSNNKWWRSRGERQIVNSPVQGAASDLTLNAMVAVNDKCARQAPQVVLTVHDSIIWEVLVDEAESFANLMVKPVMETRDYPEFNLKFDLPITVDLAIKHISLGQKEDASKSG